MTFSCTAPSPRWTRPHLNTGFAMSQSLLCRTITNFTDQEATKEKKRVG